MSTLATIEGELNHRAVGCGPSERLRLARDLIPGLHVFTTSFGREDQAIAHVIFTAGLDINVVTLDTGRLFPETYAVWAETERRYGRRIAGYYPDQAALEDHVKREGIDGFYQSIAARRRCCGIRKVEPLGRALVGAAAWIAGLRATQSDERADIRFAEFDPARDLLKISPLFDWSAVRVADFITRETIPHNVLHARGFASIGCAPCTRAIRPGESERAGRWWWEDEDKKECGLHVGADGRLQRRASVAPERENEVVS